MDQEKPLAGKPEKRPLQHLLWDLQADGRDKNSRSVLQHVKLEDIERPVFNNRVEVYKYLEECRLGNESPLFMVLFDKWSEGLNVR